MSSLVSAMNMLIRGAVTLESLGATTPPPPKLTAEKFARREAFLFFPFDTQGSIGGLAASSF